MEPTQKRGGVKRRRGRASAGLVASGLIAGGILAGTHVAGAATATQSTPSTATAAAASGNGNPATMAHGPGETLLTDGNAEKAKAAALAAVPGGTVYRIETDSGEATYEAHMTKADGTEVTVKFDKNFNVTNTDPGFGAGGLGQAPAQGTGA